MVPEQQPPQQEDDDEMPGGSLDLGVLPMLHGNMVQQLGGEAAEHAVLQKRSDAELQKRQKSKPPIIRVQKLGCQMAAIEHTIDSQHGA